MRPRDGKFMNYYLGLDIGGTFVKGVCMTAEGNLLAEEKCDTGCEHGGAAMCDNIANLFILSSSFRTQTS